LGTGCGGRGGFEKTNDADRGRRSRVVLTPRRWRQICGVIRKRRWQQSPVTEKSTKETVKTIAQGRPDDGGVPVVTTLVCFSISHARLRVRLCARLSLRPLLSRDAVLQRSGVMRAARLRTCIEIGCLKIESESRHCPRQT
jgi:hypothetical protein